MRTTSARLDPVGRFRLPRRALLLRLAAAAGLLLTATGVLYAGEGGGRPSPAPAAATDAPDPGPDGRLPIPDGTVGVPVTLGDPASQSLLRPGDRVDLFAVAVAAAGAAETSAAGGAPGRVAGDVPVLAVDRDTAALLLALTPEQGRAVVSAPAGTVFAVLVRG